MRIHRGLWAAGVLLAAVGMGRGEIISYDPANMEMTFIAPVAGIYDITAAGGEGGSAGTHNGGLGGVVEGKFFLSQNEILTILIGGQGQSVRNAPGSGGGGTYVIDPGGNALLIAGGGGGAGVGGDGAAALGIATTGGDGGVGGATDDDRSSGGGGGGLTGDGGGPSLEGGASFTHGGEGGLGGDGGEGPDGAFGGGGGAGTGSGGGGGGGYTGGFGGAPGALGDGGGGGSSFDADPDGTFSDTSFGNGLVVVDFPQVSVAAPTPVSVEMGAVLLAAVGMIKYRRRCHA